MSAYDALENDGFAFPGDAGVRQERADVLYGQLHREGVIDEPFEWPSVRMARENRQAMQGQQVICESITDDPVAVFLQYPEWPAAVHETESHNDEFDEYSYYKSRWLGFLTFASAEAYVSSAGAWLEIAGPGEFLGTTFCRTAYENPAHRIELNEEA